jgi:hypothetical protein
MAKETLSIDLDPVLIDRVRRYSERNGTDVAGTISQLISTLPAGAGAQGDSPRHDSLLKNSSSSEADTEWRQNLPPITRSLLGIASGGADEEDYKEYLWRKYGP